MEKKIYVVLEVFTAFDSDGNKRLKTTNRPINWFERFGAALKCCKTLERKFGFTNALYSLEYKILRLKHREIIEMDDYQPLHPIN